MVQNRIIFFVLLITIFLFGCSEQEFREKYDQEIRQEIKEVVKESVKEVLVEENRIELIQSGILTGTCTFDKIRCLDFVIYPDTLVLEMENTNESDFIITDFLIGKCLRATSNHKSGNSQRFLFGECSNGIPNSVFDEDLTLIMDGSKVKGHITSNVFEK